MELNFTITEKEYLDVLEGQLRRRRRSAVNIIALLVMTVVQTGFVIWYIASGKLGGALAWVVAAMSALICAMQLLYQACVGVRARHLLEQGRKNGSISESFWRPQHISLDDDALTLVCGKQKLGYDCAFFVRAEDVGEMLILTFRQDRQAHQLMIPHKAFAQPEAKALFIRAVSDGRDSSIRAGLRADRRERPAGAGYSVEYSRAKGDFARDHARCMRQAYFTRAGWNLAAVAKLAGAAFLLYNLFAGTVGGAAYGVFAALVSAALLFQFIVALTPLGYLMAKRGAEQIFAGLDRLNFSLDVCEDKLVWSCESFYNEIPADTLLAVEKDGRNAALYMSDGTFVSVPVTPDNSAELSRCCLYLAAVADGNWKSGKRRK